MAREWLDAKAWKTLDDPARAEAALRKAWEASEIKQVENEPRTLDWVISTPSVDRDGDTVAPAGMDSSGFLRGGPGPVLFSHEYRSLPVAYCPIVTPIESAVVARSVFPTNAELGLPDGAPSLTETIFRMVNGRMGLKNASIGFRPQQWAPSEERGASGFFRPTDFLSWELLEWSIVPVPANAEALVQLSAGAGVNLEPIWAWARKALDTSPDVVAIERASLEALVRSIGHPRGLKILDLAPAELTAELEAFRGKRAIPYKSTPKAPEGEAWDGPGEVAAAEVSDLKTMCTWVADKAADELAKGDFKLPHHKANGEHAVVWRGVAAAAARLPQADIPESDVAGVKLHLGKHYAEFDRTPPWDADGKGWERYERFCAGGAKSPAELSAFLLGLGLEDEAGAVTVVAAAVEPQEGSGKEPTWEQVMRSFDQGGGAELELPTAEEIGQVLREALAEEIQDLHTAAFGTVA